MYLTDEVADWLSPKLDFLPDGCCRFLGGHTTTGYPRADLPNTGKKGMMIRRLVVEFLRGSQMSKSVHISATCGHRWCVSPDHLHVGVKGSYWREARYLTDEQALAVKNRELPVKEHAEMYGVSVSTIESIRYGKVYRDIRPTSNPASPQD